MITGCTELRRGIVLAQQKRTSAAPTTATAGPPGPRNPVGICACTYGPLAYSLVQRSRRGSPGATPTAGSPHPGYPGTGPQAICFGSRSSHVTGMIAALDARDRTGRRRSVLPRRSARDLGPRADPGWMLAGPNSLLSTTHSGPRGADAPGAPGLSDRESGESAPLDLRPGRFRELNSRAGEWGLPSPAMGYARDQGLSN